MLDALIRDLQRPDAYPHPSDEIKIHQTHISVVFLAGDFAYKLKKPLDLDFLDYSTLSARRRCCDLEVRLNRRLAPSVYLDVVPIRLDQKTNRSYIAGPEENEKDPLVEWAVKMKRLSPEHTLEERLRSNTLNGDLLPEIAALLASFHANAERSEEISAAAKVSAIGKHITDNFDQTRAHQGATVHPDVFRRLETLTRAELSLQAPLIDARASARIPSDGHGDLRLEHFYIDEGEKIQVVDCVEFNDSLRQGDPINDLAFLLMDLKIRGYFREAQIIQDSYLQAADDPEGAALLPLFIAYRSTVRAKVHGIKSREDEVDSADRKRSFQKARAHWLFALSTLEPPHRRPELLMLAGLPASGKSTLGREMLASGEIDLLLDSDVVRKELAGLPPESDARDNPNQGIYTPEFSEKTYRELQKRAEEALYAGQRVAVAATFVKDSRRRDMVEAARRLGLSARFLLCDIPEETALQRIKARTNDASDADASIYGLLKNAWEEPSPAIQEIMEIRDTSA